MVESILLKTRSFLQILEIMIWNEVWNVNGDAHEFFIVVCKILLLSFEDASPYVQLLKQVMLYQFLSTCNQVLCGHNFFFW
jgi:hypothetical protein